MHVGRFGVHVYQADSEPDPGLYSALPRGLAPTAQEQCGHWSLGHLCVRIPHDSPLEGYQQVHWQICEFPTMSLLVSL